jgi:hypothetical protein
MKASGLGIRKLGTFNQVQRATKNMLWKYF